MILAFHVDHDLQSRLTELARILHLSRAAVCRRLLAGVLSNEEQINRWKDAVLGSRFTFMDPPKLHRARARRLSVTATGLNTPD